MSDIRKRIDNMLKLYSIEEIKSKEFLQVEILLCLIHNLETKVKLEDGWSVLTKYFFDLSAYDEDENKKNIYVLRENYFNLSKRGKYKELISIYLKCNIDIRLFDEDDYGYIIKNEPRHEKNREKYYYEEVDSLLHAEKIRERNIAEDYIEYTSKINKQNKFEYKKYSAKVHDLFGQSIEKLPEYREKVVTEINDKIDWKDILNHMGEKFKYRPNIKLKLLDSKKSIKLDRNIHIVGALGAGKSTFKFAYTYKSVKEDNCKIGIIEDNVANVISTVKELRKIGINAVPIIGQSTELEHLIKYVDNVDEEGIEDDDIVKFLSGNCIVKSLANDLEDLNDIPCNRLREDNIPVECPYSNKCGKMYRYRAIYSAEVLVTTPYSLTKGKLKSFIDPYERGVYELFYDLLDFIIVDEADGVQSILDSELMPYAKLNYGDGNIIKKAEKFRDEILDNDLKLNRLDIYKFEKNVRKISDLMPLIIRILLGFKKIQLYIQNVILTPRDIFNEIKSILKKEEGNELQKEEGNDKFIEYLSDYLKLVNINSISEEDLEHPLCLLLNKIESIHNANTSNIFPEAILYDEIKNIMKTMKVKLPLNQRGKQIDEQGFIEKIEFFIIMVQIDYLIRIITKEYANLHYKYQSTIKYIDGIQMLSDRIMNFAKEPCIGTLYGYKFMFNQGVKIDMMRYAGIGRSLLDEWSHLKEDIGLKGPGVITLSGTSYSPESAHYNLKKSPDILLLSEKCEGKIDMKYILASKEESFIRISGNRLELREESLKYLVSKLIREIRVRVEQKKKILIIVNSYADCNIVSSVLSMEKDFTYAVIGKEADKFNNVLTKDNIEEFEEITDSADICIVPLQIISRGYNILDSKTSDSYFSSAFFLIRPYMVPGDFKSYIQILHYKINNIIKKINSDTLDYSERLSKFRKLCFSEYNKVITLGTWRKLSDEDRNIMSWYMLVPIKQAIGRMQRNGNDCEVIFSDVAFCEAIINGEEQNVKNSIFYAWNELLEKYMNDEVIKTLFGNFNESLKKLISDINHDYIDSDDYEY